MSKHTASTGSSSETLSHLNALKKAFQVAQHVGAPVTVYWFSGRQVSGVVVEFFGKGGRKGTRGLTIVQNNGKVLEIDWFTAQAFCVWDG
jgi:hypothetical protein